MNPHFLQKGADFSKIYELATRQKLSESIEKGFSLLKKFDFLFLFLSHCFEVSSSKIY